MGRGRSKLGLLIPRPHAFMANSLMFGGGVLFAWLEGFGGHVGNGRLMLPSWLFVLLWFLVQEVLVQQAKYMWDDIRDNERDQRIPANSGRPIAREPLSKTTTLVMAGRWSAGVVLAGLLSPVLLTVVLVISGLQIVYELWAKSHAAQQPTLPLFVVGAGALLKFIGGCLAMGWPAGEQRLWLYGLALFATCVVYVSSFWRVEAVYFEEKGLAQPRGQSAYYAEKGMAWLKAGTAVTITACTILIIDGSTHFLAQTGMHTGFALGIMFAAGVVCCQFCFWLVWGRRVILSAATGLFIMGCAGTSLLRGEFLIPLSQGAFSAALLLLVLLIDHRLNYRMDYKQQNLIYLSENWPSLRRVVRLQGQRAADVKFWQHAARLVLALNTPKYQVLRERQERDWPVMQYLKDVGSPARNREVPGEGRTS